MALPAPALQDAAPAGPAVRRIMKAGRDRARQLVRADDDERQLQAARRFCYRVSESYWRQLQRSCDDLWPLPQAPSSFEVPLLFDPAAHLARTLGEAAARLDAVEAGYRIGGLYTALLPNAYQARRGIFYTPRPLAERLLDHAEEAGVDWTTARVLDPACGGGAFLAPVGLRMAAALRDHPAETVVDRVGTCLRGYEIDPFGAWMAQLFLEAALMDVCRRAGRRLPAVVDVCDSLDCNASDARFDLVVGNPPYGKTRLSKERRQKFDRSLFGHANLYGLFYDLALRLLRPGGAVAFLTPTSFLAGQYFKALRHLLGHEAQPVAMDFVAARKDVFDDVLQEALLDS